LGDGGLPAKMAARTGSGVLAVVYENGFVADAPVCLGMSTFTELRKPYARILILKQNVPNFFLASVYRN
jgi:hypothetical protein